MSDSESDDDFHDAEEVLPPSDEVVTKLTGEIGNDGPAVAEVQHCLDLVLNNKFREAEVILQSRANDSVYHALGYGTILFIQAMMTFEHEDIQKGMDALKHAAKVAGKRRKKEGVVGTMAKFMRGGGLQGFTTEQLHAEVCYAEALLLRALLMFIKDDGMVSFIKGGMQIRSAYNTYKALYALLLKAKEAAANEGRDECGLDAHFTSAIDLGIGGFNLFISLLPAKLLKLLEFIGFGGDRDLGFQLLDGASASGALRSPLADLILLAFHTVVTFVLNCEGQADLEHAKLILDKQLARHPTGALFLYFAGRINHTTGKLPAAVERYGRSIEVQQEWVQLHHLCYWELMWCHAFQMHWEQSAEFAQMLFDDSRWSKATYLYIKGSVLLMLPAAERTRLAKANKNNEVTACMKTVPSLKQKFAGKSIPIEKFVIRKTRKYFSQKEFLMLPALEVVYIWNGFSVMGNLLRPVLEVVEAALVEAQNNPKRHENAADDLCLGYLLKGTIHRQLGDKDAAHAALQHVFDREKEIKLDHWVAPFAHVELAQLLAEYDDPEGAKTQLKKAKDEYKHYSLENRCHFRIHNLFVELKETGRLKRSNSFDAADLLEEADHLSQDLLESDPDDGDLGGHAESAV